MQMNEPRRFASSRIRNLLEELPLQVISFGRNQRLAGEIERKNFEMVAKDEAREGEEVA